MILSDALNHASIVDAIRLAKPGAEGIYPHSEMADAASGARARRARDARKLVVTDGVFSMEGDLASCRRSSSWRARTAPP